MVHVHIGNLNWNKEDVVFSYILALLIEKDLFSILPVSRRDNSYCRSLTKVISGTQVVNLKNTKGNQEHQMMIDELYNAILSEVSGVSNAMSKKLDKNLNHPKGSKCGFDKASQRYCWLNYVTLLFNTKGVSNSWTLEFRPMSGTLNYLKIKNWLKICMAFCAYVENHKSDILNNTNVPVTLEGIISKIYPLTGGKLISYIKERRQTFMSSDESIDYTTYSKLKRKSIKEVACAS